ncbi:MAG: hypothetical protein ACYDH6_02085 [Acidimicrobiales bacterium]
MWAIGLLIGDLALAVALFGNAWAHPSAVTIGRRTDAPYTVWAMAWVARALSHGLSPLITHALSWPGGVNLMTNATVAGLGIVLAPVTWLWGPLVAFDVAATAAFALTAWSAQLVLRRARLASWPAAAVGGLVGAFGPLSLAQQSGAHLHVTAAFLIPPLFLGLGRVVSGTARHPGRWGIAIGALAAAQLLVGEELLAIAAIVAAVAVVVVAALRYPVAWRPLAQASAVAATVFMLLATWPLWVQFAGSAHISGPIQHGSHYPNDLTGFITPNEHMWLTGGWVAKSFSSEGGIYLGIPLVIVAVVTAVWRRADLVVKVVGITAGIVAVLSFGDHLAVVGRSTGIPMPWILVGHLPLLESLIPVRVGIILDLAAGALLAVALDGAAARRRRGRHFAHRRPSVRRALAPVALGVVCLLPLMPKLPFPSSRWDVPAFFRSPTGIPDNALVVLAPYPEVIRPEVEIWLAAAGDRWRSAGGAYFVPDAAGNVTIGGTAPLAAVVENRIAKGGHSNQPERDGVRAELRRDNVAAVIVGPGPRRDAVLAFWTSVLGPPRVTGGVAVFDVS